MRTLQQTAPGEESCAEFTQLLLDRQYDEASAGETARLESHLLGCASCRRAGQDFERIGALLSEPAVRAALAPSAPAELKPDRWTPWFLAWLATGLTFLPAIVMRLEVRGGTAPLFVAVVLWTLCYQALFAWVLAWRRHEPLPVPVDGRAVLYGLFACEGGLMLAAGLVLGLPLLESGFAAAVRLSLPGLLTALSGSLLVAVAALLGARGNGHPAWDACAIATLHALLLLPCQWLIRPSAFLSAECWSTLVFLALCTGAGIVLGLAAGHCERTRAAVRGFHPELA